MRQACSARGIVHVHTEFSFDGSLEPAAIAEKCQGRGLSFAAIADHAESMNPERLGRLVQECRSCSSPDILLIPGLEHRFRNGVHILALGQRIWRDAASTIDLLNVLAQDGCVLVAAHCTSALDIPSELLRILTAMEVWNVTRDTRLLPTSRYIPVYQKMAETYPNLYAIGGLDMHKGTEWGCEVMMDLQSELSAQTVFSALRNGQFTTRGRFLSFGSRPAGWVKNVGFVVGDALAGARHIRDRVLG